MNKPRRTTHKRLGEILGTVNTRVVHSIGIKLDSSCSSDMPSYMYVTVGTSTYSLFLADIDYRYWEDGIIYAFNIIRNSGVPYTCNKYIQQTCSGYKIWTV